MKNRYPSVEKDFALRAKEKGVAEGGKGIQRIHSRAGERNTKTGNGNLFAINLTPLLLPLRPASFF